MWVRNVPAKQSAGVGASAKVYDIPITHVLDHLLKSPSMMAEMRKHPGGEVLDGDKAEGVGLGSEHVFSVATRPIGNVRRNNMHGKLASSMPMYSSDGFISCAGTRLYIGDTVMCDFLQSADAQQVPCRVVRIYFDKNTNDVVVVVRRFRNANEVLNVDYSNPEFRRKGVVRLWEEVGQAAEQLCGVQHVLDLCEILSFDEVNAGKQNAPWVGGARREGWTFLSEGFTRWDRGRFRKIGGQGSEWRRAGTKDENFPDMRASDVHHNEGDLPFVSLPARIYVDDFQVWGMTNPVSSGVQRLQSLV